MAILNCTYGVFTSAGQYGQIRARYRDILARTTSTMRNMLSRYATNTPRATFLFLIYRCHTDSRRGCQIYPENLANPSASTVLCLKLRNAEPISVATSHEPIQPLQQPSFTTHRRCTTAGFPLSSVCSWGKSETILPQWRSENRRISILSRLKL